MRGRGSDETCHLRLLAGDCCFLLLLLFESTGFAKAENRPGKRNLGNFVSRSRHETLHFNFAFSRNALQGQARRRRSSLGSRFFSRLVATGCSRRAGRTFRGSNRAIERRRANQAEATSRSMHDTRIRSKRK